MRSTAVTRLVAPGVIFVETPLVNWVVLAGDGTITLIDAGYPKHLDTVANVLESIDGELTTILVTHGHVDHIGSIRGLLAARPAIDVLASAAELPNLRRHVTHQVGSKELLPRIWRPSVLAWTVRAIGAGGLDDVAVPDPQAIEPGREYRFSGHAVVPLAAPGHTPGHLAYWLPAARVLACGDAIATGHPTSRTHGVQLPARYFNTDDDLAHTTMEMLLREPVEVLLPGHGPRMDLARPAQWRED